MGMTGWVGKLPTWYAEDIAALKRAGFCKQPWQHFDFDDITWRVSPRATRKAGLCWSQRKEIWLNGHMTEEHARSTFRHELAHLLSYWFELPSNTNGFRGWGHGPVFKKWARAMGDSGDRCHSYTEIMACRRGTWAHCPSCKYEGKKQWRRNDPTLYFCKKCRVTLVPGQVPVETKFAKAVATAMERPAAQVAEGAGVRDLMFQLDALREGGLGSSREAKALRRALRRLDPDWRNR